MDERAEPVREGIDGQLGGEEEREEEVHLLEVVGESCWGTVFVLQVVDEL